MATSKSSTTSSGKSGSGSASSAKSAAPASKASTSSASTSKAAAAASKAAVQQAKADQKAAVKAAKAEQKADVKAAKASTKAAVAEAKSANAGQPKAVINAAVKEAKKAGSAAIKAEKTQAKEQIGAAKTTFKNAIQTAKKGGLISDAAGAGSTAGKNAGTTAPNKTASSLGYSLEDVQGYIDRASKGVPGWVGEIEELQSVDANIRSALAQGESVLQKYLPLDQINKMSDKQVLAAAELYNQGGGARKSNGLSVEDLDFIINKADSYDGVVYSPSGQAISFGAGTEAEKNYAGLNGFVQRKNTAYAIPVADNTEYETLPAPMPDSRNPVYTPPASGGGSAPDNSALQAQLAALQQQYDALTKQNQNTGGGFGTPAPTPGAGGTTTTTGTGTTDPTGGVGFGATGASGPVYGPDGTKYSSAAAAIAAGVMNYTLSPPMVAGGPTTPGLIAGADTLSAFVTGALPMNNTNNQLQRQPTAVQTPSGNQFPFA